MLAVPRLTQTPYGATLYYLRQGGEGVPFIAALRQQGVCVVSLSRGEAINRSFQSLRPMMQFLARPGCAFLDVGSGEGVLSLKMAAELRAGRVILVDTLHEPVIALPAHTEFHRLDVHAEEFVRSFQYRVHIVTCTNAFHEFDDPVTAACNLIRVLPTGGATLILDYTA